MKKINLLVGACALLLQLPTALQGQSRNEVLLTIDEKPVTKEEFVYLYQKNNQNLQDDSLKKSPEEYLELFINYKLKVLEAKALGMDTISSFQKEFKTYRDQVAQPYLTYTNITDESLKEAYRRMITEVKASHILIKVSPNALQNEVDSLQQKCMEIREEIANGSDFSEMARKYSDDPSAAKNNGSLGYFTGFQMVPEFEEAAFNLQPGELSMPVRSKFGFHLIQLEDQRPSAGRLQVAHIMKRLSPNADENAVNSAMQEMDSLSNLLNKGADFSELARLHSDDKQSGVNGGVLPWFTATTMVPEFAAAAFKLEKDGDLSGTIRTPYGLHLIKRLAHQPVPEFEELKQMIEEKLRSNPLITEHNKELFIQQLKDYYHFKENSDAKVSLFKLLAEIYKERKLNELDSLRNDDMLFQLDTNQVSQKDFVVYLKKQYLNFGPEFQGQLNRFYNGMVNEMLIETENNKLETKYPEFRHLIQEYYDGILLFNLSEEKIWKKAQEDTLGLQRFHSENSKLFNWDERFEGWAIRCDNQDVRDYIEEIFAEDSNITKNEIMDLLNDKFKNQAFVQKDIFAQGENELVDYLVWNKVKPTNYKDGLDFVRGNLIPPAPKTLDEARGQYISAYQDELEKQWIAELRKAHKIKVNKKVLKSIENIK